MRPRPDRPVTPRFTSPGARRSQARKAEVAAVGGRVQRRRYLAIGVLLLAIDVATTVVILRDGELWGLVAVLPQALGLAVLGLAARAVQPAFVDASARGYLREAAWLVLALALTGLGLLLVSLAHA